MSENFKAFKAFSRFKFAKMLTKKCVRCAVLKQGDWDLNYRIFNGDQSDFQIRAAIHRKHIPK